MKFKKSFVRDLKRSWKADRSILEIFLPPFQIEIQITGPTSGRGRRTVLLMIFRKLKELWDHFEEVEIYHVNRGFLWTALPPKPISFRETPELRTIQQRVGYALRSRRHFDRLTLREVSELTGVNIGHLSEIERGKHRPSKEILQRIESGLALYEREGVLCLSGSQSPQPKNFRKSASTVQSEDKPRRGDPFYEMLGRMFEAQQRLDASIVDSDPPPKA